MQSFSAATIMVDFNVCFARVTEQPCHGADFQLLPSDVRPPNTSRRLATTTTTRPTSNWKTAPFNTLRAAEPSPRLRKQCNREADTLRRPENLTCSDNTVCIAESHQRLSCGEFTHCQWVKIVSCAKIESRKMMHVGAACHP